MALPLRNYFQDGEWVDPPVDEDALEVLAADSFVVDESLIVGFPRHRERFFAACVDAGVDNSEAFDDFVDRSMLWFPREGRWFPRLDVVTDGHEHWYRYHHRIAPPRQDTARLAVAKSDTRQVPWRKGPDLERMAQLRMHVSQVADEALILSADGIIIEGAYSAIVVIDADEGEFSLTPAKYPRIESVTEQLVSELARDEHFDVIRRTNTVAELEGKEVWVLAALHGIRVATEIVGGPPLVVNMGRRNDFQERLREYEYPLDAVF
jgi:hypothetical protein